VKTGNEELHDATNAIHDAKGLIKRMRKLDTAGRNGEISAAMNPTIVMGATTGAAKIFAITDIGLMYPESATMTGAQKIIAAMGGARNFGFILGATKSNPAVARTERANPGSRD
jgi:hypothetical protein